MSKKRTRVRSAGKYIQNIQEGQSFQIVVCLSEVSETNHKRAGIGELQDGQSVLPNIIGPISRFNANGKYITHKDQPKEQRYITTFEWSWEQWAPGGGKETQYDFVDVYRECYPRTLIPPPGLEVGKITVKGESYAVVGTFKKGRATEDEIVHGINLCLELFGDFEIVVGGEFNKTRYEKINWKFLPPGEYPWQHIVSHVTKNNRRSERYLKVVVDRQEFLLGKNPVKVYTGEGGFKEYVAYVFSDFAILDSVTLGNALYIFGQDWADLSKLTKAQIISGQLAIGRVVHTKGLKKEVSRRVDELKKPKKKQKVDVEA